MLGVGEKKRGEGGVEGGVLCRFCYCYIFTHLPRVALGQQRRRPLQHQLHTHFQSRSQVVAVVVVITAALVVVVVVVVVAPLVGHGLGQPGVGSGLKEGKKDARRELIS